MGLKDILDDQGLPVVALLGRTNVGKSTLFNRLTQTRAALVHASEHTTRDIKYAPWQIGEGAVMLADTCGMGRSDSVGVRDAQARSLEFVRSVGCVVLVVNAQDTWTTEDQQLLDYLRSIRRPFLVAVNKSDEGENTQFDSSLFEAGEHLIPISALHGLGLADLEDQVTACVTPQATETVQSDERETRLSIVGRPNVGKSTLFNRLLGEARSVVSDEAGTTMDVVEERLTIGGVECKLIDTAGARKQKKVHESLEESAVSLSLEAIRRSHYVVVVLNAEEGVTQQDIRLIQYAWERQRCLILVANRVDLAPRGEDWKKKIAHELDRMMPQVNDVPLLAMSALTGSRVGKLARTLEEVIQQSRLRIRTSELNVWLERLQAEHPPKLISRGAVRMRKRPKFYYGTQTRIEPITVKVFCNFPQAITAVYERFMIRSFREAFGLTLVPVRFELAARIRAGDGED